MLFVIARYRENVDWKPPNNFVVQKGVHLDNWGRESSSFLWYIIHNYDSLGGHYCFVQGNPFDHCKNLLEEVKDFNDEFKWLGDELRRRNLYKTPKTGIDLIKFINDANIKTNETVITFKIGCQFIASANRIRRHPKKFYIDLFNLIKTNKRYPYAFERVVGLIWG